VTGRSADGPVLCATRLGLQNMDISVVARWGLAVILGVAGLSKAFDARGTSATLGRLGVSVRVGPALAWALPGTEIAVAAWLLASTGSVRWAEGAAFALFVAFAAGILWGMATNRRTECGCFGKLHSSVLGLHALIRASILAAAALALVVAQPIPTLPALTAPLDITASEFKALLAGSLIAAVVLVNAWVAVHVLQQQGRLLVRIEDLERQAATATSVVSLTEAPYFELPDHMGNTVASTRLWAASRLTMLAFVRTDCAPTS
jgi:hypothetical protein